MIITLDQFIVFGLIIARMMMMVLLSPVFSSKEVFSMGKVTILIWTSLLLIFYIPLPVQLPTTASELILAIIIELLIGAILGFTTQLLIIGIEFAGNLMDTQAGLSVASLLDPATGQQTTIISKMVKTMALLVFLLIDGHHVILGALVKSFTALPIGVQFKGDAALQYLLESSIMIFRLGLQLSAPILMIVFLIDFGFGMLSRVAPQVNVFQLGFQIKPIVSIFVLMGIIPGMADLINTLLQGISATILDMLFLLKG